MKKYDEMSVLKALDRNPNVRISHPVSGAKVIQVVKGANTVGNGTWGKIDYLCNYCGYVYMFININEQIAAKIAAQEAKKSAKREAKAAKAADKGVMKAFNNKVLKMRK